MEKNRAKGEFLGEQALPLKAVLMRNQRWGRGGIRHMDSGKCGTHQKGDYPKAIQKERALKLIRIDGGRRSDRFKWAGGEKGGGNLASCATVSPTN